MLNLHVESAAEPVVMGITHWLLGLVNQCTKTGTELTEGSKRKNQGHSWLILCSTVALAQQKRMHGQKKLRTSLSEHSIESIVRKIPA